MDKVMVLMSGGIDSTVCAALAHSQHRLLAGISFNYGQRAASIECSTSKEWCHARGIQWIGLMLPGQLGRPLWRPGVGAVGPRVVPARNAIFASCAASWAATLHIPLIWYGATLDDYADYPDCRPAWIDAMSDVLTLATDVRLEAPLVNMKKAEVVALGNTLGVDWSATWSCYQPRDLEPCETCNACITRRAALEASTPAQSFMGT